MSFGAPLGLLALAALAPLLAAYFLRRRQKPRIVSALFLWRSPSQRAQAGPKWERFSRELSLLLEVAAIITAALFLADLRCGGSVERRHLVVVVDGSLSMQAVDGGKSVAEKVRDAVARRARADSAQLLTVVETGLKPVIRVGPQAELDVGLSKLEAWRPSQPSHDVLPALQLARELSTARGQTIAFFTDGPLGVNAVLPDVVEVIALGKAVDNVALVSAQRHDEAGAAVLTVRVASYSAKDKAVEVKFKPADATPGQTQKLNLAPGATAVVRVGFRTAAAIEVSLPDDALEADSKVTLLEAPTPDVNVALLEGIDPAASAAVKRFVSIAPGVHFGAPAALTFGAPKSGAKVTIGATPPLKSFVGPFFAEKGHPLLDDVQLDGVVWTVGATPKGHPLVSAGEAVMVTEEEDGTLHLNVDLGRSNVQRTPAWPVLLGNVLRSVRNHQPGFPRRHLSLGEDVPVVTEAGAKWALKGPSGEERPILTAGALQLPPLPEAGRWELLKDGKPFDALAQLPLDARESDLRTRAETRTEAKAQGSAGVLSLARPRALWPLMLLLLLLMLDFALTARDSRPTVAAPPRRSA